MSAEETFVMRVGPEAVVEVKYRCNGCAYHTIGESGGCKYHACKHPAILNRYTVPQAFGCGYGKLDLDHVAETPKYMCPYLKKDEDSGA